MSRLALSDADKQARDWFIQTVESLGCQTSIDAMGNVFAVRPGRLKGPPTFAGSHLDTQPAGGRYDGILGVCAGIEMMKVLHEKGIETEYPTGVVNWTNEEGARFPISMISSGVWSGEISLEKAHDLEEVGDSTRTMRSELERIGYLGDIKASHLAIPMAAHFELHIEQGPRLESQGKKIGVVQGVQAYKWFSIIVKGREGHTGTTDFVNRSDALLAAAKFVLAAHRAAVKHRCLASVGILNVSPGSVNTIPGTVRFSLDIRSKDDQRLIDLELQLKDDFEKIVNGEAVDDLNSGSSFGKPCSVEWRQDSHSSAISFNEDCIQCVEQSAADTLGGQTELLTMISGAGHDSVYTSKRVPTAMVFVPCREGLSHNPAEYCSPEDCANGAQVLLGAVLRYDKLRAKKHQK